MKQINIKEDFFFGDVADKEKFMQFQTNLIALNQHYFLSNCIEVSKERDEHDNFVFHKKQGVFKTLNYARDYFNQLTDSPDPVRLESRAWNQQHQILSKAVIIDLSNNEEISLLNCLENVCERFGGKCNEETGCSTVPFANQYARSKKLFPIRLE
jgi:hypothetical protein